MPFNLSGFNASGPCGCCGGTSSCPTLPCGIPYADLTASWEFSVPSRNGSGTMVYNSLTGGSAEWVVSCFPASSLVYKATLTCHPLTGMGFRIEQYNLGTGCTGTILLSCKYDVIPRQIDLTYTCSPFHLDFVPNTNCSTLYAGLLHFYIDYP